MSSRQLDFFCTSAEFVATIQKYDGPYSNIVLREWFPANTRKIESKSLTVEVCEGGGQQLLFVPSYEYPEDNLEQAILDPTAIVCTVPKTKGRCLSSCSLFMSSVTKDQVERMHDKIASFEILRSLFKSILKKPVFSYYDRVVPSYHYSAGAKDWEDGGGVLTSVFSRIEAICYIERRPTLDDLCE